MVTITEQSFALEMKPKCIITMIIITINITIKLHPHCQTHLPNELSTGEHEISLSSSKGT